MNLGAFPYDPATDIGRVRLLVGDTDPTPAAAVPPETEPTQGTYLWYSDAEVEALLDQFGGNKARTAAHVIRAIARSEALLLKKFTSADLAVDGPAIARALLQSADSLDREAEREDQDYSAGFEVVPTGGISATALLQSRDVALTRDQADRLLPWLV